MKRASTLLGISLICVLIVGVCNAPAMTYSDSTAFFNDLTTAGLTSSTLDFDSLSYGDIIADGDTVDGITFNYDFGGVQMMISDIYETTSPPNFLGTDDGDLFLDGDNFSLSFATSNAIGLSFLTADEMFDDDILLTAGSWTAGLIAGDVQQTLADGSFVYFLGIIDQTNTFTGADIDTIGGGYFFYNVDDIVTATPAPIPEPGTLWLLGVGLLGVGIVHRSIRTKA